MFDDEDYNRVKVFDWAGDDGFPKIMAAGGFDAVIGNPPYIRIQVMQETSPESVAYYSHKYQSAKSGNYDIYVAFVERGINLLNDDGLSGFILPHKFFTAQYGYDLRGLIAQRKNIFKIVHFGDEQVFANATTYTCLLFLTGKPQSSFAFTKVTDLAMWRKEQRTRYGMIDCEKITSEDWHFLSDKDSDIYQKLLACGVPLEFLTERMSQGIRTSANDVYVLELIRYNETTVTCKSKILDAEVELEKEAVLYFLQGRQIRRYKTDNANRVVIMPYKIDGNQVKLIPAVEYEKKYPLTWSYLNVNKERLEARENRRFAGNDWYVYGRNQNIDLMLLTKILVPDIASDASFALDHSGVYAFTSGYGITLAKNTSERMEYVLGLLNSKPLDYFLKLVSTTIRGGYFRYFTQYTEQLPIRTIDFDNPADVAKHDQMVELVQTMLDLNAQLADLDDGSQAHKVTQMQIDATDKKIDALVYDLYGLTDEEIAIVENA
jgi:hypothetical protein